ncbi:Hypothetical predicted protein [Pelobates cultripes]|uniref:Uncharacterized protein n=1 Tax=Pelobates cultripes TaxID=61616 RepID=A0AAD1VZJ4_PELCU|nr:Hypothetical predicted protein [Pelobates cultripes]
MKMVRNKKRSTPGTAAADSPRRHTSPMDGFLASQPERRDTRPAENMASGAESMAESQAEGNPVDELALIRDELTQISARMLTKTDTGMIMQELRAALREELAGLRSDLNTLKGRVEEVEAAAQDCPQQHQATETAVNRQGNLLLTLPGCSPKWTQA